VREGSDPVAVSERVSFEDFYLKDYEAVVGLAYALSGSRWLAEDLAQEAFLAAHRNWPKVSAYDQPGAWVRRVVANLSVSAFRRRVVEAKAIVRLGVGERRRLPELLPDDAGFWEAVRSLPRRQSQVVALHYLEDLPIAEVAAILDMAPGTVKKHLFDGRRALARRLRIEEDEG
jgi:RNA polymerase sigma-70 factor (ECF subfamily)